uniref:Uncharacterized protein n=1 Tax=viral metagenome TaxID=1070528 RepID=A0A6C0EFS9_9ZZZZ
MKVWMLFGTLTYFLIVVIFGYSLSGNIESNVEYMIFWMLYISSIFTISILVGSFFMSLRLKDLKGMPGERGEMGESGEQGETGACEINCRDEIGYKIIMNAIKNRLKELEAKKRGEGKEITEIQRKMNDYIRYYDNMNLTTDEIIKKLDSKKNNNLIVNTPSNEQNEEIDKYKTEDHIKNVLSNKYIGGADFDINNSYIKEKVKTILDSDEFREMTAYRGPLKLIEYIKDLWLEWIKLIYDSSNLNYFTSVGVENDFERFENNPFNEIKKYDVFNWGLSNKTRPRVVNVKEKYETKVELGDEGFENYKNIKKSSKVKGRAHPNNKARLKIMRTNNYYFTYDDRDTTMMEQIRSYRPYSQFHNGDRYYPLGDIVVGPSKENADDGDELIFSDRITNDNDNDKHRTTRKKGKTEGPNRDTILVAGDVKKPIDYETKWYDLQKTMARHWTCKLCKKEPKSSYYRGIAHTPICETGYTSLGDIYTSQDNQTDELKERTNKLGSYEPILNNQPVCIPTECVEVIEDSDPKIIWDTYRSQRPSHGSGSKDWYKYVVDNAEIYSFTPNTGKKGFVKATHENSYNLSKIWLDTQKFKKLKPLSEWASKDSHLDEEYTRLLEEKEDALLQEQAQEQEGGENTRERFIGIELLVVGIQALAKGLEKPQMVRPYMYRIKDECIIKDDGNISFTGDDYKWPSILKEDKTGNPEEDATVFFISENEKEQIIESIPEDIDSKVRSGLVELKKLKIYLKDIEKLNKFFKTNNYFKKSHITTLTEANLALLEILEDPLYEYKNEDYSYFYYISEYIAFLSSLPSLTYYDNIRAKRDEIHTAYRAIIDPINEEKINKLKLKLGLGWKGIPRFDDKGEDYSTHHFFYINNKGFCEINNITLEFNKVENPDLYTLKNNNLFLEIKENITEPLKESTLYKKNSNFHFKLKFLGSVSNINEKELIIIIPANEEYKNYVLTYDNPSKKFIFLSDKEVKTINNYIFNIKY